MMSLNLIHILGACAKKAVEIFGVLNRISSLLDHENKKTYLTQLYNLTLATVLYYRFEVIA